MAWRVVSGPEKGPWEGKDVVGWVYDLEADDGRAKRVLVEVSGPAMASDDEALPSGTVNAKRTQGRSAVEAVSERQDPPSRITCGTDGCQEA